MPERHPNLYDRDRWRRYGYALAFAGIVLMGGGLAIDGFQRTTDQPGILWVVLGTASVGLATSFWLRQRYSYVQLLDQQLEFRVLLVSQRIDLAEIRRARVGRLGSALEKLGGGRQAIRTPSRWQDIEALILRLRQPDDGRLRRLLSRRCVFEDEVVVPVADAAGLQRGIEAALARTASHEPAVRSTSRRRGRRR
ncbi:MAG TPA: hypothetical protein VEK76_11355 [Candidatus Binatia bacterium]|nr:hypothetical protein [Candidatus Binatia bacterium]